MSGKLSDDFHIKIKLILAITKHNITFDFKFKNNTDVAALKID